MLTSLQIVTPPAAEPASIDLVRMHCRIDHSSDDLLLSGYLASARTMAEAYLSRALITQTLLWTIQTASSLHSWSHFLCGPLQLPRAPVQSVLSVTAMDTLGNATTLLPATLPVPIATPLQGFIADTAIAPAQITIGQSTTLSDGRTLAQANLRHIQITFTAGYGADYRSVPQPIINSILLTTAHLYENRGDAAAEMPRAAEWLLDPYRLMWMGA